MSTPQYDAIGNRLSGIKAMPLSELIQHSATKRLGNVQGLKCLDLACGLGDMSQRLIDLGATRVVGVDVSSAMIQGAQAALPADKADKIKFLVGDCSKPLDLNEGPFDFIYAGWLLNYASDPETMTDMWRVIHDNLKPGGRFTGVTINALIPAFERTEERFGFKIWPTAELERGWECRLVAQTPKGEVALNAYWFKHDVYEETAKTAGMRDLTWYAPVAPDDERKDTGFWDTYMLRSHMAVISANRQ